MKWMKWYELAVSIATIICSILMILYGLDVVQLSKPVRVAISLCLVVNAVNSIVNYKRTQKLQGK